MPEEIDFGHLVEGVVELDPITGRYVIRTFDDKHRLINLDVQDALARYKGQEVRFILTPFATIKRIAEIVEDGKEQVEINHPSTNKLKKS